MGAIGMPWKAEGMAGAGGRRTLMRKRRGTMQIMARPAGERGCAQERALQHCSEGEMEVVGSCLRSRSEIHLGRGREGGLWNSEDRRAGSDLSMPC